MIVRWRAGTSVNWIDAVVGGYIVGWRGFEVLVRFFPPALSRWLDFPYGWAYAGHLWYFAVPVAWWAGLRRRFPIGGFRWCELRGWIVPGAATLGVSVLSLLVAFAFAGKSVHDIFDYTPRGWLFEATVPGLGEEFLFRGLFQSGLNGSMPIAFFVRGAHQSRNDRHGRTFHSRSRRARSAALSHGALPHFWTAVCSGTRHRLRPYAQSLGRRYRSQSCEFDQSGTVVALVAVLRLRSG